MSFQSSHEWWKHSDKIVLRVLLNSTLNLSYDRNNFVCYDWPKQIWVKHRKYLTPKYARLIGIFENLFVLKLQELTNYSFLKNSRIQDLSFQNVGKYWRDILNLEIRNVAFWIDGDFEISHLQISLDILLQSQLHTDQKIEATQFSPDEILSNYTYVQSFWQLSVPFQVILHRYS